MSEALEELAIASHFDLWLASANSAKRATAQARQKAQSAAVAEAGKQSRNHKAAFLARQRYRRRWLAAGDRRKLLRAMGYKRGNHRSRQAKPQP